jgi:hypothetical protein
LVELLEPVPLLAEPLVSLEPLVVPLLLMPPPDFIEAL